MERTKRTGTDFDSPSAHPYPPQAEKIRFDPFHPFDPFYNHAALAAIILYPLAPVFLINRWAAPARPSLPH